MKAMEERKMKWNIHTLSQWCCPLLSIVSQLCNNSRCKHKSMAAKSEAKQQIHKRKIETQKYYKCWHVKLKVPTRSSVTNNLFSLSSILFFIYESFADTRYCPHSFLTNHFQIEITIGWNARKNSGTLCRQNIKGISYCLLRFCFIWFAKCNAMR